MRKLDFLLQAAFVIIMLLILISRFWTNDSSFFLLIGLFFLGIWQLVSALINTVFSFSKKENDFIKLLRWYWLMVVVVGFLFISTIVIRTEKVFFEPLPVVLGLSVLIAFYYLFVCYKMAYSPENNLVNDRFQ